MQFEDTNEPDDTRRRMTSRGIAIPQSTIRRAEAYFDGHAIKDTNVTMATNMLRAYINEALEAVGFNPPHIYSELSDQMFAIPSVVVMIDQFYRKHPQGKEIIESLLGLEDFWVMKKPMRTPSKKEMDEAPVTESMIPEMAARNISKHFNTLSVEEILELLDTTIQQAADFGQSVRHNKEHGQCLSHQFIVACLTARVNLILNSSMAHPESERLLDALLQRGMHLAKKLEGEIAEEDKQLKKIKEQKHDRHDLN